MGNYLSKEYIKINIPDYIQLANLGENPDISQVDAIIESVIERAEGFVDGYLGSRYQTPLTGNSYAKYCAYCVAEYELYKRGQGSSMPEKIRISYDKVIESLQQIALGNVKLNNSASQETSSASGAGGVYVSSDEVSVMTDLTRF